MANQSIAVERKDINRAELVRVIQETMQPEHVSVWLKAGTRKFPQDES